MNYLINRPQPMRRQLRRWVVAALIAASLGIGAAASQFGGRSFTVVRGLGAVIVPGTDPRPTPTPRITPIAEDPDYRMPDNDKKRLDILLLGIRGDDDPVNGGLLTDTIMLVSLDTRTGRASMISVPRDLTVRITDTQTGKINAAYAHYGISGTKKLFSRILGTGVDNVVVVDFDAFKSIVDALGGVTITLDKPFEESQQWAGSDGEEFIFKLPAGENTLNGDQALYYVRSRYSTSDFDRARRQQQILVAMKNRVEELDLGSNPRQALELVQAVRSHITTDLDIFDLGTIRELFANAGTLSAMRRYQLTTENLLYETTVGGVYELLPRGDTLAYLQKFVQTVLSDSPVMTAPTPQPSPSASP